MAKRYLKGRGNWTYGKSRSDSGRKGRGENALSAKVSNDWKATLARIEAIVARAEHGSDTMTDHREVIHLDRLKAWMRF